jgi:hypothetical protein
MVNVQHRSAQLMKALVLLSKQYPIIDVRGRGLMVGVEFGGTDGGRRAEKGVALVRAEGRGQGMGGCVVCAVFWRRAAHGAQGLCVPHCQRPHPANGAQGYATGPLWPRFLSCRKECIACFAMQTT